MVDPKKLLKQVQRYERFKSLTRAIQMVAMSQLASLNRKMVRRQEALIPVVPFFKTKRKFKEENYSNYLLISIAVDKSCCGPHNGNIFKSTLGLVEEFKEKNKKFQLVSIGKRAKNFLKSSYKGMQCMSIYNIDTDPLSMFVAMGITEKFLQLKFDCCIFLFNRFYTAFRQNTSMYRVMSYERFVQHIFDVLNDSNSENHKHYHLVSRLFNMLDSADISSLSINFLKDFYEYCYSLILLDSLEENEYSSLGARATAMNNATKNASEIISNLRLKYNKARQEQITTELIDIVTAVNFT